MLRQWRSSLSLAPVLAALAIVRDGARRPGRRASRRRERAGRRRPCGGRPGGVEGGRRCLGRAGLRGSVAERAGDHPRAPVHAERVPRAGRPQLPEPLGGAGAPRVRPRAARGGEVDALVPVDGAVGVRRRARRSRAPCSIRRARSAAPAANITGLGNLQPFLQLRDQRRRPALHVRQDRDRARGRRGQRARLRVGHGEVRASRCAWTSAAPTTACSSRATRAYVVDDAMDRLDKGIQGIKEKIAKGDRNVTDVDRLRLEAYKQEVIVAVAAGPQGRGVRAGGAPLHDGRPDELRRRPTSRSSGRTGRSSSIAQYLEAARILRPDVNMARAGVVARRALVDVQPREAVSRLRAGPRRRLHLDAERRPAEQRVRERPVQPLLLLLRLRAAAGASTSCRRRRASQQAESQLEETRALERLALGNAMFEVEKAYADAVEAKGARRRGTRPSTSPSSGSRPCRTTSTSAPGTSGRCSSRCASYAQARVQHLYALMDYNVAMSSLALASGWDSAAPTGE